MAEQQKNVQDQDLNQLRKVRREKLADLQARGADPFLITKYDVTHHSQQIKDNFEELEGREVSVAGRIMQKRVMGKASFCNIQDLEGNIQSYVARDNIGEDHYKDFKKFDIGDIVGIQGTVFKTKTGEISIHAEKIQLLSKSLQILPEKFHGLTDTDTRYRQRYVDLIMNREVKETFIKRSKILSSIRKYLDGEGFLEVETLEQARALAKEHNVEFEERHKKGDILSLFFEEFAEEHLIQPTFVMDHPIEISPLTKKKPGDPDYVERFEFFMNGWEMANAYSELNDPIDQRERFKAQEELLAQGDEEANTTDEDFLNALEIGMPPTGGIGFGIDRMCMLLTDSAAIRDVLLFPTMKAQGAAKNAANNAAQAATVATSANPVKKAAEKIDFSNIKIEPLFEEMVDFETFAKSDYRAVKILACEAVPKSKKLLKFTLDDGVRKDRVILSGIHEYYEPEELVGKTAIAIVNLPPRKMMGIDSEGMLISAVHEENGREGLNLLMVDDRIPAGAKLY